MFNKYILIGTIIIFAIMSGIITFQYKSIEAKNKEIATLEIANEAAEKKINILEQSAKETQKTVLELSIANKEHQMIAADAIRELEEAKSRKGVVLARPTLVNKLANKATNKVFNEIECLTGACSEIIQ